MMSEAQIPSPAQNRTNAIPSGQAVHVKPVIAQQGMQKVSGLLRPKTQLRTGGKSHLVVVPVVPEVAFESKVLLEVVGEGGAEAVRHIGNRDFYRCIIVPKRRWNPAAGMQPLITHKDIVLGSFHVLRQGDGRQQNYG